MSDTESATGTDSGNGIRISVVEEDSLFRAGIVHVLNVRSGITVVAEGESEADALRASTNSDVLILDARLLTTGPQLVQSIAGRGSSAKVLLLVSGLDEEQACAAFSAGARGCVLRSVSGPELVAAVQALHRGEGYVSPTLAAVLLTRASLRRRGKTASASPLDQLTFREGEIFRLLAAGLKNSEIGQRVELTEKSVKKYVTSIFEKLQVRNRVEAAMLSKYGQSLANGRTDGIETSLRAPSLAALSSINPDAKDRVLDTDGLLTGPIAAGNEGARPRGNGHTPR